MDRERRRQALQNYLLYLQQDIEREIKGKEGKYFTCMTSFKFRQARHWFTLIHFQTGGEIALQIYSYENVDGLCTLIILMMHFDQSYVFCKSGVEKLMEVYHNRPNFADADAQEDARQRLTHVRNI